MAKDYYDILGVSPAATLHELKIAYRRRAKRCHPDKGGTEEQMIALIEAWHVLSDPEKRAAYDAIRLSADPSKGAGFAGVAQEATTAAAQTYEQHGQNWREFSEWIDVVASDVHRYRMGRLAAGAAAGVLLGGLLGALVGVVTGVGSAAGIATGALAGAIGGSVSATTGRSRTV